MLHFVAFLLEWKKECGFVIGEEYMKLLIADDEELTREGLIASIDWAVLGVREIFQADDGLKALKIAESEKPDIILSDIRMPRLTGIEMAEQLEKILPDTSLIFMSGYSDKEYLKAAIKLKAINYVEKPLNPEEIKEAVMEACAQRQEKLRTRQNEALYSLENFSQLAFLLTRPYRDNEAEILSLTEELSLRLKPGCSFTTYIVKTKSSDIGSAVLKELREDLEDFLLHYHLSVFYIRLHGVHHVFHIMGEALPSSTAFTAAENYMQEKFTGLGDFYIGRGETVTGISKVYQSYTSAVITLQSCFFFAPGSILKPSKGDLPDFPSSGKSSDSLSSESVQRFSEALLANDEEMCTSLLEELYRTYHENLTLLPNQVKDIYYKLFMTLNDCRQKMKLAPIYGSSSSEQSLLAYLENCFSYQELQHNLSEKVADYFHSVNTYTPEDSTIFLIKDYIAKHYAEENLSIKQIGDHVFLSASYVCTYFKTQTGQTLNQYLTEYRMEKAKQLLGDARYQIADISSKVGYSNGNYFSKSFKKFTGLSPSKYREKILG